MGRRRGASLPSLSPRNRIGPPLPTLEHKIADLLLSIEAEMRRLELWEAQPPPAAALRSQEPFCIDTLDFRQWVQWILIPRMKDLLERGEPFPAHSDIFPLAEEVLADLEQDTRQLLQLIRQFDETICGRR